MSIPLIAKLVLGLGGGALLFGLGAKEAGAATKKMPPWLLSQYQTAKANAASNPQALGTTADTLRANGFPAEADELVALAKTRAIADSPNTSPADKLAAAAVTEVAKIQAQTPVKATSTATTTAAAPAAVSPAVTPAAVVAVPTSPGSDVNKPYVLTAAQTLAKKLGDHLNQLVKASGGVARAKGKEDESLVRTFQTKNALKVDGKWGPGTAKVLASLWGDVPIVFYWPKGTLPGTAVPKYRSELEEIAETAENRGTAYDGMRAKMIRLSEIREQGQGFGSGTKVAPSSALLSTQEAKDLQAQVAAAYFQGVS